MSAALPGEISFSVAGRRAIVTGAGKGIGLALGAALARGGAEVTLVARTPLDVEAGAEALEAEGHTATGVALDVSDVDAVRDFFIQRLAFHILVNNAGTNRPMPMQQAEPEDFDAVIDLNVRAAYFVAQACVRRMLEEDLKGGSLIHISSQMGHVGGVDRSLYCASKWAVEGMSKSFALDLAEHNIRSNTIAPTFIETPMTKPFFEDEAFRASVLDQIKLGRIGQVEDLMGAALYLASDASAMVTGTSLVVDGGWTAR